MDRLSRARSGLREMDALAAGGSPIHRLHPLSKLLVTVLYIVTVTSFPKYELSGLTVMVLYPVLLLQISEIPVSHCFYRLRFVLPLVCAVGLANPFLDRAVLLTLGRIPVTGGVVSMVTLMMKGTFSLLASFVLIAATPIDQLCAALRSIHVPGILATLLLLTYRYIGLMLGEAAAMAQAYQLRAPNQRGLHISAWGSFWASFCCEAWTGRRSCTGVCFCGAFTANFSTSMYRVSKRRISSIRQPAPQPFSAPGASTFQAFWEACL